MAFAVTNWMVGRDAEGGSNAEVILVVRQGEGDEWWKDGEEEKQM